MERMPLSYRTPQDHAGSPRSLTRDYEKWKNEMMEKPQIRRIFDIMELDRLLLNLIKLNTDMLKTKSIQNQLNQLVELIKLNVNLLIHEPDLLLDLKELDDPLVASHTTDQASTQHDDPLKNIMNIYKKIEKAKAGENLIEETRKLISQAESQLKMIKVLYDQFENANATTGQVDQFDDITKLIQQCHGEFQDEHQLAPSGSSMDPNRLNNDVVKHIVNLLPVELRPPTELRSASAKSNLNLVKWNLEEIHSILNHNLILLTEEPHESNSNQKSLTEKLIKVTNNLISQISIVDNLSNPQDDGNREQIMKSHAARIIELMCSSNTKLYINRMDSFKDICNQVAAMYKHSQLKIMEKSDGRNTAPDVTEINYTWCGSFRRDIFNGKLDAVEMFLNENPRALAAKITSDGNTALHIAVKAREPKIVRMLLAKLQKEKNLKTLEMQNNEEKTALYIAASGGFPTIAEELVKANNDTLFIKCKNEAVPLLPLFVAAKFDKKQVVKYLYEEMKIYKTEKDTSVECFPKKWARFLATLIQNDDYDMALRVNGDHPSLALIKYTDGETPLLALARRPSLGANKTVGDKAPKFQLILFKGGHKKDHNSTPKVSELLKQIISKIDLQSQKSILSDALFKAAEVGSVEFVTTVINYLPPVVSWLNDKHQSIFHVAIIYRQEKIFNIIYELGPVMNDIAGSADKFNNWMLHLTGELPPFHRLNQVPTAAMQLQSEIKWFENVKAIVPNNSTNVENLAKETPYELFVSKHENLKKDGEKWIKETASSYSIVAGLVTTVVFGAAFTIPGGNQNSGNPIFLTDTWFLIFVISDAVALFSSCTSVLIFMNILTSRFELKDFLVSLPNSLTKGIVFLFISTVAMMSAFGVTIYIIIRDRYGWCYLPVIMAGVVPFVTYFRKIFTLLIDLLQALQALQAKWNSIFKKPDRHLYY